MWWLGRARICPRAFDQVIGSAGWLRERRIFFVCVFCFGCLVLMIAVFLHVLFVFFHCSSSSRLSVHFPSLFTAFAHPVTPRSVSSANLGAVGRVHSDAAAVAASKRRLPEEGGDSNPSDSVVSNVSAVSDSTDQRCDDDGGDNDDDDDDDDHDHDIYIFFVGEFVLVIVAG
jgi:hypothetical protein